MKDEGYTVSHSASLSFSHTQTTYTSNAQHINQNPLILHKVKQKERKKSNFLGSGREKSTSCIWYNVYMRERHNKEETQEYHIQKGASIRQSLVRPESGPERRLRGFWATWAVNNRFLWCLMSPIFRNTRLSNQQDDQNLWYHCQLFFLPKATCGSATPNNYYGQKG